MEHGVQVRVLGSIEVVGPNGRAALTGGRQRALLGLLALNTGAVLAQPRLIGALWGVEPPRTAAKTLHSHVARVRQALAGCGLPSALTTRDPGYALTLARADIDACRFEEHVRAARAHLATGAVHRAVEQLSTGLALWRGDAFADAELAGWGAAEVQRLHDLRLTALEELWEAQLRLGRHTAAIGELERLLVAHPVRERLVGLLMLALYRSGRQVEALEAYRRLRSGLIEELGVEPGPELQRLHTGILRRDASLDAATPPPDGSPPSRPRPAQLPPGVGHFTGRTDELAALDGMDADTRVAVISGPAGMGKTALALHWAHHASDRFPDGQLFVDLEGHDPSTAMSAGDALAHLLRGLGVAPEHLPAGTADRTALYRSLISGKRTLVVCDNARDAEDLLPLVPTTTGGLLLVTSRNRLTALATRHCVRLIGLDALHADEAVGLLAAVLGTPRVRAEAVHAADLVELCSRMPLALRIVAAKLAVEPRRTIRQVADGLRTEDRLAELSIEGDSRSVRTVLASAYRSLSPAAARMFRVLGVHPAATFTLHLGAAAAGVPLADARRLVGELIAAHLVTETDAGRFGFHDLIRLYAYECARLHETAAERDETIARILDWYLAIATAANRTLDPGRDRVVPALRFRPAEMPPLSSPQEALAFLDGERGNMVRIVGYAAEHGQDTTAWQLTYLLTGFFDSRGHWTERIELCRRGLAGAQRLGEPATEGLMRSALGVAYVMTRRFDEALDHLHRALPLMRASGDARGEGHVYNNIAAAYTGLRRFDEAAEAFQRALDLLARGNHPVGVALALNNLGHVYTRMAKPELSFEYLRKALTIARTVGQARFEAAVLHSIGQAHLAHDDHDAALEHFRDALDIRQRIGDRRYAATTVYHIGLTHAARGEHAAALQQFRDVLARAGEQADRHLEALARASTGQVHLRTGDLTAAREQLLLALALRDRTPDAYEEAHVHRALGDLEHRYGDPVSARYHWDQAIERYEKAHATAEADELRHPYGPSATGIGDHHRRLLVGDHPGRRFEEHHGEVLVRLGQPVGHDPEDHGGRGGAGLDREHAVDDRLVVLRGGGGAVDRTEP